MIPEKYIGILEINKLALSVLKLLQAWGATQNPQLTNRVYKKCTAPKPALISGVDRHGGRPLPARPPDGALFNHQDQDVPLISSRH